MKATSKTNTFAGRYIIRGGTHSLTMPPDLRERLNFHHGDYVIYLLVGDVIRVRQVRPDMILRGEFHADDKQNASEVKGGS